MPRYFGIMPKTLKRSIKTSNEEIIDNTARQTEPHLRLIASQINNTIENIDFLIERIEFQNS